MNLYLDDDTASALLTKHLRQAGHDVQLPADAGNSGKEDPEHFAHAIGQVRLILTKNYGDFERLHKLIMAAGGHIRAS